MADTENKPGPGLIVARCIPPLVQVIRELPAHTTLALLTISGSVSVYHLRGPGMAAVGSPGTNGSPHIVTADCFPGMNRFLAGGHLDTPATLPVS